MPSYPSNQNPWDQRPDFQGFERAVDGGVPGRPTKGWLEGGQIIQVADNKKAWSPLDHAAQYAIDHYGASQEEANEFKRFAKRYGLQHPIDALVLGSIALNKPGTISQQQDRAFQKAMRDKDNRVGSRAREVYNSEIASGKLRIIP